MPTKRLPVLSAIQDTQLKEAILNARTLYLGEWSDTNVIQLIDVVDHILTSGRAKFPTYADDDSLALVENLETHGYRPLHELISQVGKGGVLAGLTLLAASQNQRDIAIQATKELSLNTYLEPALRWHKHYQQQRRNGREAGMKRQTEVLRQHAKVRVEIKRLRKAQTPEHQIASKIARRDGSLSAHTIRRIKNKMDKEN